MRGVLKGEANVRTLQAYLAALRKDGRSLPARNGSPNLSKIAEDCGFDRGVFYSNQLAKQILDDAWRELGLDDGIPEPVTAYEGFRLKDEAKQRGDGRTKGLEEEILRLRAENAQLRAENNKYKALQRLMAETGRMP